MESVTLGVDVACRVDQRAALADERGEILWSRSLRTTLADLEALWARLPEGAEVTVVLVPPEQASDLRDYYAKHTKTDRLDARMLARVPLLHPEGLREVDHLEAVEALRRGVKRRAVLTRRLRATLNRISCLLEFYGPVLGEALGTRYGKASLAFCERYGDPSKARRLGRRRLGRFLRRRALG